MRTFIREKKVYCGPEYLEVDLYPYTKTQAEAAKGTRSRRKKVSQPKQMNLNDKNARRYFTQLGNTNFGEGDLHVTLTYNKQHLPPGIDAAENEVSNFLRRVKYARSKKGLPPLKYMLVTEYKTARDGDKPTRIHHHIIMSGGLDRDEIENLWRKRKKAGQKRGDKIGFANADRLQPQGNGIAALCTYITKQPGGKKRWTSSQNLDRPGDEINDPGEPPRTNTQRRYSGSVNLTAPISRTNDYAYSKKELARIARDPPGVEYWEKRYPGYTLILDDEYAFQPVYNEETGHWAAYVKLRRKWEGVTV